MTDWKIFKLLKQDITLILFLLLHLCIFPFINYHMLLKISSPTSSRYPAGVLTTSLVLIFAQTPVSSTLINERSHAVLPWCHAAAAQTLHIVIFSP